MSKEVVISQKQIENRIFTIRGKQVMIDRDLAEIYQVETRVLNQAVKRNIERFPEKFRFQLSIDEVDDLKSQIVTSSSRSQIVTLNQSDTQQGGNIKYLPYAFTEQGVAMLSAVLRSDIAVQVSIQIMDAFVEMRKLIANHSGLLQRMDRVEHRQIETDQKFEQVFKALEGKDAIPDQGYFELKAFSQSHDRFLIIDGKEVYHLGASLKDLGKKWFAFSKMEARSVSIIENEN